ncbi:DEAD/DEAH box helicase [Bacillus sp. PS06]|uniref:DEAD/DEAH box helicase n=1 Tax=Bacillus sp. PS06 TaxID=2764176 RepID=UPI001780F1A1|nr:DEAD/DEAH box helicase [Bacillus sp. PS06]MBD8069447.1 DEAD/DEAH box helicase [Bacillus sp. PS06]
MLVTRTITIECQWDEMNGCYLWGESETGDEIDQKKLRPLLFSHHKSSFYGSFVEMKQLYYRQAFYLTPWQALEFFGNQSNNTLAQFNYSEDCRTYQETAEILYKAVQEMTFVPDYEQWALGEFGWTIEDEELDLFSADWLTAALEDWFEQDPVLSEAWGELLREFPLIKNAGNQLIAANETDWLEKIGWIKDMSPFNVVLRLIEPDQDDEPWQIETMMRDKEKEQIIYAYGDMLPIAWRKHVEKIEREQKVWTTLVPWLRAEDGGVVSEISEFQAWSFLTEDSELLLEAGVEIQLPSWWQAIKDAQLAVKAKVKSTSATKRQSFVGLNALIDFDWRFSTNGVDLSEDEFMSLVDQKRRLVNIRGRWIKLDPAFIKQVQSILSKANKEGLSFRDVLEQELLDPKDADTDDEAGSQNPFAHVEIELNRHLSKMVKQLSEIKEIPPAAIPSDFTGELRPYQQQGVDWLLFLRRFGFGACLADDMGLGKTIQMIAYFLSVKEQGAKPSLIICPTSVLGNWQKELEKFGPTLKVHLHYGANRGKGEDFPISVSDADVVLTSYGLSHLDYEEISAYDWGTICLDEAQNIKNAQTKQSRAIRRLSGAHHIALTGTPMENRLTELWSIFDFTNEGYLGSLGQFQKRYVAPIEKDRDTEKIGQLQRLIRPFLLRRTKKDEDVALNLPDKQEQKEYCPLTVEQASMYEQLVKDTFEQVEQLAGMQRKGLILKMLSKLKQVCNHPALYLKEDRPSEIETRSNKMDKLMDLVTHIREQDESCLIFTQYIQMGEMIKSVLEKQFGEEVMFLNGSIAKNTRDEMIASFQNRKYNILILSLKAGGTGLNLTEANHVIHYDRWWNPAVENQATDRAYRIGQKRFVHVHKLISTGTLEEKIDEMLEKKQALNDEIIQSESWITELSNHDLKDLLSLR